MAAPKRRLKGLSEHSVFYKQKAAIYEEFSKAEDIPEKILRKILPKLENKVILDVGCGSGKYIKLLSPHIKSYYGLDISKYQLSIATKKIRNLKNINLICRDATATNLPNNFFDAAVAFWAISPIAGWDRKKQAITETFRTLKRGGSFYLIENDETGFFEEIRGAHRREETTEYNQWVKKQGFGIIKKISTYFEFNSKHEARKVFGGIWGDEVGRRIKGKRIGHKVIIFEKRKA